MSGFAESRIRELETCYQIFASERWTTISGLSNTINGREDPLDSRQARLNGDMRLLRIGSENCNHSNHVPNDLNTL
jgi:hypothetical protein